MFKKVHFQSPMKANTCNYINCHSFLPSAPSEQGDDSSYTQRFTSLSCLLCLTCCSSHSFPAEIYLPVLSSSLSDSKDAWVWPAIYCEEENTSVGRTFHSSWELWYDHLSLRGWDKLKAIHQVVAWSTWFFKSQMHRDSVNSQVSL